MRKFNHCMLLLMAIIVSSCVGGKNQENNGKEDPEQQPLTSRGDSKTILIDFKEAETIDQNLKAVSTIVCDEDAEEIIGIPQNITVKGDTIYVIDSYKAPGFYAYLRDGKQLFAYCKVGNGPEEFFNLTDINVGANSISAFDNTEGTIITIDKAGNFVDKESVGNNIVGAIIDTNGGYWVDLSNQEDDSAKLSWRQAKETEYSQVLPVPEILKGMKAIPLQQFNRLATDEFTYLPAFENKIYTLENGKAYLRYILDFKDTWRSDEDLNDYRGPSWALRMREFPITRLICQENVKWLIVGFYYNGKLHIHAYDKIKGKGHTYYDDKERYYIPMDIYENELFMLMKDGNLEILKID